ncbi:hypothetical protein VOLCADRAFT_103160 [Volvox carteri f. nagariensis]|uniref:Uncharacterized protein n=1 Tax=Volvox carteri f. nagariensis TaxID=3068 RepID=D8TJW0_VOLCA|nr:uncharacterized protein VOLCADRAFT_103160 [Volvox carteri f. nagariensis]EFJ51957.1 hypothetical protein VOLCADRAFT_103160 [Volvox carteri f. nagariensis]|eukprot:XP_002946731.1 hypothetical protein VOLCADRAFT_103160 [Volvox carteri f. nagariensis]
MSKYRFREYDALGLNKKVPGEKVPSLHHISKHKQKKKNVEVVFDVKDYKQIKEKQRQERNHKRSETVFICVRLDDWPQSMAPIKPLPAVMQKREKLKEDLGLGDDYGIGSSSDDASGHIKCRRSDEKNSKPQPQSVTVYRGESGMTTTVTTMALQSSDDEQPGEDSSSGDDGEEEQDAADSDGGCEGRGGVAGPGPSSARRGHLKAEGNSCSGRKVSKRHAARQKAKPKQADKAGGAKQALSEPRGGVRKAGKRGASKQRVR